VFEGPRLRDDSRLIAGVPGRQRLVVSGWDAGTARAHTSSGAWHGSSLLTEGEAAEALAGRLPIEGEGAHQASVLHAFRNRTL
jgi:hypothetical protein